MKFRSDINGLRAYAVAMVVLFHYGVAGFGGGFIGVDVFFVISGYLMTSIIVTRLQSDDFSVLDFYWERFRRIVPALACVVLILVVFGWFSLPPAEYQVLAKHAMSALSFTSNMVFGFEAGDYFATNSKEKWLLHTWSLSVEWQFYLIYPLYLLGVWKFAPGRRNISLAIVFLFCFSLMLSALASPYPIKPKAAFYFLPTRAWEMAAGGLVFLFRVRLAERYCRVLEVLGFSLLIFALLRFDHADLWPGYLAFVPVFGTVLILSACNASSVFTAGKLFQWIGSSSYSIYLWHWPVFVCLYFAGKSDDVYLLMVGVFVSAMLGYLSYRFVETPCKKLRFDFSSDVVYKLFPIALSFVIAAFVLYSHGGISRLGSDMGRYRKLQLAQSDWQHPDGNCNKLDNGVCHVAGGGGNIFFIGDSHVEQLYPRYAHHLGSHPAVEFRTQRGCIPVPGVKVLDNQNNCALIMSKRWDDAQRAQPKTLVVGAAWLIYLYEKNGAVKKRLCFESGTSCQPFSTEQDLSLMSDVLVKRIRQIKDGGTEVILLGPWPHGGVNYAAEQAKYIASPYMALPFVKESEQPRAFDMLTEHGKNFTKTLVWLQNVADQSGAKFYKPTDFLCKSLVCQYVEGDMPTHMDAGHITAEYAKSARLDWLDGAIHY